MSIVIDATSTTPAVFCASQIQVNKLANCYGRRSKSGKTKWHVCIGLLFARRMPNEPQTLALDLGPNFQYLVGIGSSRLTSLAKNLDQYRKIRKSRRRNSDWQAWGPRSPSASPKAHPLRLREPFSRQEPRIQNTFHDHCNPLSSAYAGRGKSISACSSMQLVKHG